MSRSQEHAMPRPGAHSPIEELGGAVGSFETAIGERGLGVSRAIHERVLAGGEGSRRLADLLHGTWLGHPLHPVLTDATIGALTYGAAFDALGAVNGNGRLQWAGDRLTEIGVAAAVPTALAGLTEFSTVPEQAAGKATLHGLLNGAALGLYVASIVDRRRGRRGRGVLFSTAAFATSMFSAWLGGHLSYRHRVGVNHAEKFDGPRQWQSLCSLGELPHRHPRRFEVDGHSVLLFRDGGEVMAIGAVCSHAGGPLEEGAVEGCLVQCPWHDSLFDMRDGSVVHGPATAPVASFDTRVSGGRVEIRLGRG